MRSLPRIVSVRSAWLLLIATAVAGMQSVHAHAAEKSKSRLGSLDRSSIVGGLAVAQELEPLREIAAIQRDPLASIRPVTLAPAPADPGLRMSVPDSNRARSLVGGGDVFATSKVVLPLLVADMDPAMSSVSRPMSGSPVGVRPTLPLFNRIPITRSSIR